MQVCSKNTVLAPGFHTGGTLKSLRCSYSPAAAKSDAFRASLFLSFDFSKNDSVGDRGDFVLRIWMMLVV